MLVMKEIETQNGLFRIGAVVLNENEIWKDNFEPIPADNDFVLHFHPKQSDSRRHGTYVGHKHFKSLEEAEAYVNLLNLTGFSVSDL